MYVRTHKLIGSTATILLLSPTPQYLIPFLIASNIGSISPDFDHETVIKKYIMFIPLYFILLIYPFKLITISNITLLSILLYFLVLIIFSYSNHRTLSHSIIGLFLFISSTFLLSRELILPLVIGYVFHLFADSFTKTGIKLFDFKSSKKYGFKIFNMHDIGDNIFFVISFIFFISILILKYDIINLILMLFSYLNIF